MYGFDPYIHEPARAVSGRVRNFALDSKIVELPEMDQLLLDVHSGNEFDCDQKMSALTFPLRQVGGSDGDNSRLRAASCAQLRVSQTQKIIRSNQATSFDGNTLGDFTRRPTSVLAELCDSAIGDTDRSRKVAALDARGFEVCG